MSSLWKPKPIISVPLCNKIRPQVVIISFLAYTQESSLTKDLFYSVLPVVPSEHSSNAYLLYCFSCEQTSKYQNFRSKNIQHIYVLSMRTWSCASWWPCSWKIFSSESIYCDDVPYVVRKMKIIVYSVFKPIYTEVFRHTVSRAKIKLWFTETFNLLFCRHTTKWQIKGLFCYKLSRVQSWVKISLFFLESLCKESASQPASTARTLNHPRG